MRGIRRQIDEEWILGRCCRFLNEPQGIIEEHVSAISLVRGRVAVVPVGVVEVVVAPVVGRLAHAATAVINGFLEASVYGTVGRAVAEVPFAEEACGVADIR